MKVVKTVKTEVIESEEGTLKSFLGKKILLMCANYFYTGTLLGVNETCVLLGDDAALVYDAGKPNADKFADVVPFGCQHSVQIAAIESFGKGK